MSEKETPHNFDPFFKKAIDDAVKGNGGNELELRAFESNALPQGTKVVRKDGVEGVVVRAEINSWTRKGEYAVETPNPNNPTENIIQHWDPDKMQPK